MGTKANKGRAGKSDKPSIWKRLHWGQLIAVIIPSAVIALFLMYYFTTSHELRPGFEHFTTVYRDWKPRQSFPLPGKIYYRSSDSSVVMAHDLWSNDDYEAVKVPGMIMGYSPKNRRLVYSDTLATYLTEDDKLKAQIDISFINRHSSDAYPVDGDAFFIPGRYSTIPHLLLDVYGNLDTLDRRINGMYGDNGNGGFIVLHWDKGYIVIEDQDTLCTVPTDGRLWGLRFYGTDKLLACKVLHPHLETSVEILSTSGQLIKSMPFPNGSNVKLIDVRGTSGYFIVEEREEIHCPFKYRTFYKRILYQGEEKLVEFPLTQMDLSPISIYQGEDGVYILYSDYDDDKFYVSLNDAISPPFTIDKMYKLYVWAN